MDQVKKILAVIKKHHFWILCGLAVLIGLGMTITAKSKLLKGYDEEKTKISGAQSSVAQYTTGNDHPNPEWIKLAEDKTTAARQKVFDAWNALYQEQAKKVFVWPSDLMPDNVAFLKEFAAADDQTEKKLDRTTLNDLGDRYMSYIAKVALPRLATIIDAEWTITDDKDKTGAGQRSGVGADGTAVAEGVSHKVVWDPADQQQKVDAYDWSERPSRLDMQYAQEEMWVMEALFKAIQRANSHANGSYDAAVRKLDKVLVGYDATSRFPLGEGTGRIIRMAPTATPAPGAAADTGAPAKATIEARRPNRHDGVAGTGSGYSQGSRMLSRDASAPSTGRGGPSGFDASAPGGSDATTDPTAWLKDGRYVSAKCEPLAASEMQNSTTPEYKLMAFRLELEVDEAQYPRIIEELASSVLPIEVREVRILPGGETAQNAPPSRTMTPRGSGSGGRAVRPLGPSSGPRDASAPTTGSNRPFQAPRAPAAAAADAGTGQHNLPLEIYGVAYLIERPDRKKLNLPEPDSSATAATPAATTAPAPATATTGTTTSPDAAAATGATPAAATATTATTTTTPPPATAPTATTTEPAAPTNGAEAKGNSTGPAPAAPTTGPADVAPK